MAYNDDALRAKLSTLNETQESIVSVSQWITFHRRYADRIAQVWLVRLRDAPPPKRLNYIYLVNDIVQNAKARKRAEFPTAFAPIIAEAVQQAYRSSTKDIQGKIQRVIDVWKQRGVFEESILQAIQARVEDVDKSKATSGKKLMGNSLFSSSSGSGMPKELESLGPLQTAVTKAEFTSKPLLETVQSEYTRLNDPATPRPSAPVYAANLSSLIKKLNSAEAALNESVATRKKLVADLKRITEAVESTLSRDESTLLDLSAKRTESETSKRDVEDSIMRGLSEAPQDDNEDGTMQDTRPDVEELTPEPDEMQMQMQVPPAPPAETTLSPPPAVLELARNPNLQGILAGFGSSLNATPAAASAPAPDYTQQQSIDIPGSPPLNSSSIYSSTANGTSTNPPSNKKRKLSHTAVDYGTLSHDGSVPDLGAMGVTGYDGVNDYDPNQYMASAYANMSFPTAGPGSYTPTPATTTATDIDLTSTLEADVDALIRGNGGADG